jgi:hypothetical protein
VIQLDEPPCTTVSDGRAVFVLVIPPHG